MWDRALRVCHHSFPWALVAVLVGGCKSQAGPPPAVGIGCKDPAVIDDMEDGDAFICPSGGRHGEWYMLDDGTSTNLSPMKGADFTQTLIPGGRETSLSAARMTGFGFTKTGVEMGFHVNGEGFAAQPYDASAFEGVRFWMKTNVPTSLFFTTPETLGADEAGGTCVDGPTEKNCDNFFRYSIVRPKPDEWVEYDVPFSTLTQVLGLKADDDGNAIGGSLRWDPSRLVGVQFDVGPSQTFDVWVDDIRFYSCANGDCLSKCTDPSFPVVCPPTQDYPTGCRSAGTDCAVDYPGIFQGAWGSGPNDVWAVGRHTPTATTPDPGTTEHWDGTAWSAIPSAPAQRLRAVWGTGSSDVWAVGYHGVIEHWDGVAWSAKPSGTNRSLNGVWGSGPSDVWVVGYHGIIEHWDGATWSSVPSGTTSTLNAVWGSGADDVWAVGGATLGSAIQHWDGATWSTVPNTILASFFGIWGSGPTDVWAVGLDGIAHWNGATWSVVLGSIPLNAVWGSGPNDAWAVGYTGATYHWNGTAWSRVLNDIPFVLAGGWSSSPTDAWIVGYGFLGTIRHWDGAAWSAVPVGPPP